ncbi:solute carrier organic anion transporter family member 6A1-like isoform X3 [Mastomys coucha]|uniref:solute carrier organic anion transporter family member 6A1-like isoform X3 n=1 Tax=Mastomys coucha TaxID=35658 RepID=UPI001261A8AC|nr:solute carrier organic anion transporter family member 6A1-like isoform X3 [Mastomys coucha]
MAQDKRKIKDRMEQAQVVERDKHQKTEGSKKIEIYLTTIPTAVKKFADISDKNTSKPNYGDSLEGPFGFGRFVFPCLQRFNTIKFFMMVYLILVLLRGMMLSLVDMSLKIFVSQFFPSNSEKLLMDTSDYFATFLLSMFVAYFGGRGNRAKWVAAASILTGLSAIVFALPFFNYEIAKLSTAREEDLCVEGKKSKVCGENIIPHKSICIYLFIFGQFLHGIAGIPIYLLAITFIFEHVPTSSSGLYIGTANAALMVGYILGFLLGTSNFRMPVQEAMKAVGYVQRFRILQRNWWKSYFSIGSIAICTTLPLFCFPSNLPGAHKLRLKKSQEPPSIDRRLKNKEIKPNLKGFLYAIWCLLRNPLVLTQTFCKVTESMTLKASTYFLPLYLQTQFLITPRNSAVITVFYFPFSGIFIIPASIIGIFLGGYIVDKLQMNIKNKLKFIMAVSLLSVVLFLLVISVDCKTANFSGINEDYDGLGIIGNLTAPCNAPCGCTTSLYKPVCGRDDKQYFTPCFAGCRATKKLTSEKAYYNCSCIDNGLTSADTDGHYIDAFSGTCNMNCFSLPLFFAFYFSATIFSNLGSTPTLMITMESVPISWTSMSLGVMFTIWRFVASFPAQIFFSRTSALCCTLWDINECGHKVQCWVYNKEQLFYTFVGIWISMQVATSLLCVYAVCRYDHVVTEKTKSLPTPIKHKKAKEEGEGEEEEEEREEIRR